MNVDLVLNAMVVVVALNAIASARFQITERRLKLQQHGSKYGAFAIVTGLVALCLWVTLSFVSGYWQFAALIGIPMLINFGALAAGKPGDR